MAKAARHGTIAVALAAALLIVGLLVASPLTAALRDPVESPETNAAISWSARILLIPAVGWGIIGALAARTRLVRRPGAAAARAAWLATTRPWRARESTLGMLRLDRWLLLLVPLVLLLATGIVQAAALGWERLLFALGSWLAFAAVARLLLWDRSPWPVIAAVGGVVVIRCILTLIALAIPVQVDQARFSPVPGILVALALAAFAWTFVAGGWALGTQLGGRRAVGVVLASAGAALAVPAITAAMAGTAAALAGWNGYLALVPWRVTNLLGLPASDDPTVVVTWVVAGIGIALLLLGVLMAIPSRARRSAAIH
ncbi:hypothetical protein ACIQLJ_14310 [Microbacterium sp. NPDC091313]